VPDLPDRQPQKVNVQQLAHKIKGTGQTPSPRFCFFLGAGASFESGIPLASTMITDFCQRIIQEQCPEECTDAKQKRAWLEQQTWYIEATKNGTLYSNLFDMYEQKERGRQFYIEQMIEGKKPSFGYVVLANLMARNHVNTILTTNFDDLIYNACATFTDIRPVVYAYGNMVSDLRVTNARPKILKLHGDYLYSKLKNIGGELAEQDPNMARYVPILLNEYGLVVVGYGGGDKSVMDMLRKFPPNNDLYWCVPKGTPLPDSVRSLLLETGGFYVEIESFDRMMNEIRSVVGFDVPKMFGSLEARQDQMIEQLKTFPKDLSGLGSLLREIHKFRLEDAAALQQKKDKDEALLHYVNAVEAWYQRLDFTGAEDEFRASLKLNPQDVNACIGMAGVLCQQGKYAESEEDLKQALPAAAGGDLVNLRGMLGYLYNVQGRYPEALQNYVEVVRLSPQNAVAYNGAGIAYMKLGQLEKAEPLLRQALVFDPTTYYAAFNLATVLALKGDHAGSQQWWAKANSLWQYRDHIDPYNHAVILACLGETDKAVEEMRVAIERGQPGLALFALQSVLAIESAPASPPSIKTIRQMLEQAATPAQDASASQPKAVST